MPARARANNSGNRTQRLNAGVPGAIGMLRCPPAQVYALTSFLRDNGAEAVAVADLDYVFSKQNPLFAKLQAAL